MRHLMAKDDWKKQGAKYYVEKIKGGGGAGGENIVIEDKWVEGNSYSIF